MKRIISFTGSSIEKDDFVNCAFTSTADINQINTNMLKKCSNRKVRAVPQLFNCLRSIKSVSTDSWSIDQSTWGSFTAYKGKK